MLQGMTWASPPDFLMPAATSSQASALRLETTTLAPSFASSSAEERPMPRLEPVMTATLPVRSNGVDFITGSFPATICSPDGAKRNPGLASPAFPDCASLHPGYDSLFFSASDAVILRCEPSGALAPLGEPRRMGS